MPKFNYNDYVAKQAQKQETKGEGTKTGYTGPKTEYLNRLLLNDGDYVVVRFPYSTTDDFDVVHTHSMVFGGNKYPQNVECKRNDDDPIDNCPLCKAGNKIINRFFVKAIAYIKEVDEKGATTVKLIPVVWDRPFGYAKELAGKMNEYGDLREHLFKIKRSGKGTSTTYSTDIVLNKAVYNPEIYKADFSIIEKVIPSKLLMRTFDKYLAATGKKEESVTETTAEPAPIKKEAPVKADIPFTAPVQEPVKEEPAKETIKKTTKRSYSFN